MCKESVLNYTYQHANRVSPALSSTSERCRLAFTQRRASLSSDRAKFEPSEVQKACLSPGSQIPGFQLIAERQKQRPLFMNRLQPQLSAGSQRRHRRSSESGLTVHLHMHLSPVIFWVHAQTFAAPINLAIRCEQLVEGRMYKAEPVSAQGRCRQLLEGQTRTRALLPSLWSP